jgi:hypothetical protein
MDEKIKLAIKKAQKLIEKMQFPSEEQKNISFSKAIDYFLVAEDVTNKKNDSIISKVDHQIRAIGNEDENDFWSLLEQGSSLDINILKDIYTFKKDQILLIINNTKGKNSAEQCAYSSLLICFAYHEGKKMEWVPAKYLVEAAKHLNFNIKNLNRDLKREWFREQGKKKGVQYKLSAPGFLEAKKYLNELKNYGITQ